MNKGRRNLNLNDFIIFALLSFIAVLIVISLAGGL
jgi:hypothetical protein